MVAPLTSVPLLGRELHSPFASRCLPKTTHAAKHKRRRPKPTLHTPIAHNSSVVARLLPWRRGETPNICHSDSLAGNAIYAKHPDTLCTPAHPLARDIARCPRAP